MTGVSCGRNLWFDEGIRVSSLRLEFGQSETWDWKPAAGQVTLAQAGRSAIKDLRGALRGARCSAGLSATFETPVPGDKLVLGPRSGRPAGRDDHRCPVGSVRSRALSLPMWVNPCNPEAGGRKPPAIRARCFLRKSSLRYAGSEHDPTADDQCGYLATSAGGERIYLAADPAGCRLRAADHCRRIRPTAGLSFADGCPLSRDVECRRDRQSALGQGHRELRPQDERPLRQLVDEAGWLLGVQTVLQVLPAGTRGGVAEVFFGSAEAVSRAGEQALDRAIVRSARNDSKPSC